MNIQRRKLTAVVLGLMFVLWMADIATAQSATNNCKRLRAQSPQVFDPVSGVISGPVTNGGILNGTLEDVVNFGGGVVVTPDPNVVAYTSDLKITTSDGVLRSHPVTAQSLITGAGTEFGNIDPNTSTGRFAGATGVIYFVFKLAGDPITGPWEAEIKADICFVN